MIAKIYSAIPQGYDGKLVEVEGYSNQGLPAFNIVGMAAKTVSEARERVRAAITSSGFKFPAKKLTINLAPADLPKDSSGLDLPIAISTLVLSQQLQIPDLSKYLFAGELSLDGSTRPIRGIINITETARNQGFTDVIIPTANLDQASLVPGIKITGVDNLIELFLQLHGQNPKLTLNTKNMKNNNIFIQSSYTPVIPAVVQNTYSNHHLSLSNNYNASSCASPPSIVVKNNRIEQTSTSSNVVKNNHTDEDYSVVHNNVKNTKTDTTISSPLLDQVHGQELAKRALTIAVAGHHNILLTGPPGAGKTLLAKVAANLLPDPSKEEILEIAKIHSLLESNFYNTKSRPFRSPHHTASPASIIGGGTQALPGEISLAHKGVLFLDELPEYSRNVLEALRQPLESHQITVSRTGYRCTYPADFMLIATMNPCPCGHLGDPKQACTCTPQQISFYQKKLSGPILDRIDLIIHVQPVKTADLITSTNQHLNQNVVKITKIENNQPPSQHLVVKNNITEAVNRQFARYKIPGRFNNTLTSDEIEYLSKPVQNLLETAIEKLHLTARGYFKILKVARTIADLENSSTISIDHLSEALSYRTQLPTP